MQTVISKLANTVKNDSDISMQVDDIYNFERLLAKVLFQFVWFENDFQIISEDHHLCIFCFVLFNLSIKSKGGNIRFIFHPLFLQITNDLCNIHKTSRSAFK